MSTNQPDGVGSAGAVLAQRRLAKGLAVRERILQAAVELFAARGYGAVPLVDVAQAAGLTKNHILHHFHSKAGLALAALDTAQAAWRGDVLSTMAMYPEPRAALVYAINRLDELQRERWPHARLLAGLAAAHDALPGDVALRVDGLLGEIGEQLRLICRDLRRAGGLAPEHKARTYAAALLGVLLGAATLAGAGLAQDASALEALPALLGLQERPAGRRRRSSRPPGRPASRSGTGAGACTHGNAGSDSRTYLGIALAPTSLRKSLLHSPKSRGTLRTCISREVIYEAW